MTHKHFDHSVQAICHTAKTNCNESQMKREGYYFTEFQPIAPVHKDSSRNCLTEEDNKCSLQDISADLQGTQHQQHPTKPPHATTWNVTLGCTFQLPRHMLCHWDNSAHGLNSRLPAIIIIIIIMINHSMYNNACHQLCTTPAH